MSLADLQSQFVAGLMSDDAPLPVSWRSRQLEGYDVYRNAYRARLVDALHETYPRTALLVGEEAFRAAAAHHLITCPPTGWTLDEAGRGFSRTVEDLFADDPDVAELAWVEWAMLEAFVARDASPLDGRGLAAATESFDDAAWQALRLCFMPGLAVRQVHHDCLDLWRRLAVNQGDDVAAARTVPAFPEAKGCVVWREGLRPVFAMIDGAEARALRMMLEGASFGAAGEMLISMMGEARALPVAGGMLANWIRNGWVESVYSCE